MTQQQFITEVAKYVQIYAPKYGLLCNSAIIAQACLESGYGTSVKAQHHNYFGLKYRGNRVTCNSGYFNDGGSEQLKDGSYIPIQTDWYAFESMEKGIEGYCQFITNGPYNAKGIADPQKYLQELKNNSYATSAEYVPKNMAVITKWNLTQYDNTKNNTNNVQNSKPTNSPMVEYTRISPNKTSPRNHKIDTITIHCMAGNLTIESCGNVFAPETRQASSNYGIDSKGRVGMYVEEKDRSWCSSNAANDHRAVTIEVANDGGAPDWHVSDAALNSLIKLCADICRRNDIKELKWLGDKNLIGQVDKQNMTVHRWFKAKACPGDYLYNKHGYIAAEVNKILGSSPKPQPESIIPPEIKPVTPTPAPAERKYYRVQVGAYGVKANADAMVARLKMIGVSSIIKQYDNLYKVQIGAYGNKANAEAMADIMKQKGFNAIVSYN